MAISDRVRACCKCLPSTNPRRPRMKNDTLLMVLTVCAVLAGIGFGVCLRQRKDPYTDRELILIKFPGELLMRVLKMLCLPLIVSTLVNSVARLSGRVAGRLSVHVLVYYMSTTFLAALAGLTFVHLIIVWPNRGVLDEETLRKEGDKAELDGGCMNSNPIDSLLDVVRNMFPENIVQAAMNGDKTCVSYERRFGNGTKEALTFADYAAINETDRAALKLENITIVEVVKDASPQTGSSSNFLGLIVFSLFLGYAIRRMNGDGSALSTFFVALEGATMNLVKLALWYSPVGILFIVAHQIAKYNDFLGQVKGTGWYVATEMVGLAVHSLVTLPLICLIVGRRNPLRLAANVAEAVATAFTTSSSSAAMAITMRCLEVKSKISKKVVRFLVPLGATINMDGAALYDAVSAVYIAHAIGMQLTAGQTVLVFLAATLSSIGSASIPQSGLVMIVMVLTAVGIPAKYYSLIISVDWFMDRFVTAVNVWGDAVGAAVVSHRCAAMLRDQCAEEDEHTEQAENAEVPLQANGHAKMVVVGGDVELVAIDREKLMALQRNGACAACDEEEKLMGTARVTIHANGDAERTQFLSC